MRRVPDGVVGYLVLIAMVAGPLSIVSLWALSEHRHEVLPASDLEPVYVPVESSSASPGEAAQVALRWFEAPALAYRGPDGIVTGVEVVAGEVVATGDVLFSVDGAPIYAVASARPLAGEVGPGSPGEEVRAVHSLLATRGLDVDAASDVWTDATAAAVRSFARATGWEAAAAVFRAAWVVWLPESFAFTVTGGLPRAGFPAPSAGSSIATGAPILASAVVGMPVPEAGSRLELAGITVDVGAGGLVSEPGLREIERVVAPGADSVAGFLRPTVARDVLALPASAVLSDAGGVQCVLARDAGSADVGEPVVVQVVGGVPGTTYLEPTDRLARHEVDVEPVLVRCDPEG